MRLNLQGNHYSKKSFKYQRMKHDKEYPMETAIVYETFFFAYNTSEKPCITYSV